MRVLEKKDARVEAWRDLSETSARARELFAEIALESVQARGAFSVALSGGSTPKALYQLLAQEPFRTDLPWQQTHIYWSDERCVPPTDSQSNYLLAHEALLAHVAVPPPQIHRMRGEDDASKAAADYEALLKASASERPPRLDLILLGMGDDGHTASLFPGSSALEEKERLVVAPYVEKFGVYRLTMTFTVLNAAANILFLVCGESKAEALRAVLEESATAHPLLPAARVRAEQGGQLLWLVDDAAARLLDAPSQSD